MPRKKKVEGAVLDLTGIEGVVVDVTAIVAAEEAEKAAVIERKKAVAAIARAKKKEEKEARKAEAIIKKREEAAKRKEESWLKKNDEELPNIAKPFNAISYIESAKLHKCVDCSQLILFNDRCSTCRKQYMNAKTNRIMEYIKEKGMNKCNFCGIHRGDDCIGFHFDHKNMFLKTGTVGSMLYNDKDDSEIMEEIDKCQLLCISCHLLVTKIEIKCGLTYKKYLLNKGEGNIEELVVEYDRIMIPVYERIKDKFRGLAGGGAN